MKDNTLRGSCYHTLFVLTVRVFDQSDSMYPVVTGPRQSSSATDNQGPAIQLHAGITSYARLSYSMA